MNEYQREEMKRCMAVIKGICTDALENDVDNCLPECPMYDYCEYFKCNVPMVWEIY